MHWVKTTSLVAAMAVAAVALLLLVTATPALAVDDVETGIVGFGDKDCRTGADKLVSSSAEPFEVEVCLGDGGSPLSAFEFSALVEHADDTEETIDLVTGSDGTVLFRVVPVDAGFTTVRICIDGDCSVDEVELASDNPPRPVPVASYLGPESSPDMGPSEVVEDPTDFWFDPNSGGPVAASPGVGDPAMDLVSIQYLGGQGGVARWEFRTAGDSCALYEDPPPFAQFSIFIETPDSGRFSVSHRYQEGELFTFARSEGAPLEMVDIHLDPCAGESTVILNATGLHVQEGSTFNASTWLSTSPVSSGHQDHIEGMFVPAAVVEDEVLEEETTEEETVEEETVTDGSSGSTEDTGAAGPISISEDEGGSFPIWIPFVVFGVAIGGYFWYRSQSARSDGGAGPIVTVDDRDSMPGIIVGTRPGKGVGTGDSAPPKIGLRLPGS